MSKFDILKSISIIAFGAVVGYTSVHFVEQKNSPNRYLASMTMAKMASENLAQTYFKIQVRNLEVGEKENEPSTVQVTIESFRDLPAGLTYAWSVAQGMNVLEGDLTGVVPTLAANQTHTFTLKLNGYSKEKKSYVSFAINGAAGGTAMKREVLLSSRPEDSFEYVVQRNEKARADQEKKSGKVGQQSAKKFFDPAKIVQ